MKNKRRQALTLLEVLAAFLIFSMVFTILVGTSQSAVRSQGLSARRLAANEVADLVLADLEVSMARHELPVLEEAEYPLDEFVIRVQELSLLENSEAVGAGSGDLPPVGGSLDVMSLLATQLPDVAKYLMRYDIEVEWQERNAIQIVTRTTFAFDWESAQVDVSGAFGNTSESGPGGDSDGTESDRGERGPGDDSGRSREGRDAPATESERILDQMRRHGVSPN